MCFIAFFVHIMFTQLHATFLKRHQSTHVLYQHSQRLDLGPHGVEKDFEYIRTLSFELLYLFTSFFFNLPTRYLCC